MGQGRVLHGVPQGGHEPGGMGAGRGGAHLLAKYGAKGQLVAVDGPRDPAPGSGSDQGPQHRVLRQHLVDRHRVGIQVEQPATARHGRGEVAQVGQAKRARHRPVTG